MRADHRKQRKRHERELRGRYRQLRRDLCPGRAGSDRVRRHPGGRCRPGGGGGPDRFRAGSGRGSPGGVGTRHPQGPTGRDSPRGAGRVRAGGRAVRPLPVAQAGGPASALSRRIPGAGAEPRAHRFTHVVGVGGLSLLRAKGSRHHPRYAVGARKGVARYQSQRYGRQGNIRLA